MKNFVNKPFYILIYVCLVYLIFTIKTYDEKKRKKEKRNIILKY